MKSFLFLFSLIFCLPFFTGAQLCNGGSGEPIVNITFGNTHDPLPTTVTTFNFDGGCPFDTNSYTIQNLIFGCGENIDAHSWHQLAGDHTHDINGQYMLINASWVLGVSHPPGIIHLDTATALCGNTTYQYSAWLANVMRDDACGGSPILPNIIFTVSTLSGATLATTNSGFLPIEDSRIWKQYGLSFTTPPGVNAVVLTLSINAQPGCGNAFVVDDITFSLCAPAVSATLDGKTDPIFVCADYTDPFILSGSYAPGFNDPVVQWQNSLDSGKTWTDIPGVTTLTYQIPHRSIGTVFYRMAVAERPNINSLHCRVISNPIITGIFPSPEHPAPQSIIGCISKDLHLPLTDPFALKVLWTGPNGYTSVDPKAIVANVKYADTGIYRLKQSFSTGCTSTDTFNLQVFPSTTISVPPLYSICEGNTLQLSALGTGTFKWTPATGLSSDAVANPIAFPHDSTMYKVIVTNSFGCKDSADVTINVFRNPVSNAGADRTIVIGDTVLLKAFAEGTAIKTNWSPATFINDPLLISPSVYPPQNTQYTLTASSLVGCGTATSSVLVKVYKDIFIPSAFTPNGDGKNDRLRIFAADGYTLNKFLVYNRWGQLVFSAKNTSDSWDGNLNNIQQNPDTYVYYLEIETTQHKKITKKGTVTLVR